MHTGNAVLDAVNVKAALGQFDLLPLQVADLRGPQTVAVGDQDHGRIAMPIAAVLARAVHQPVDLALGEIASLDCQVYDAWRAFLGCRFHADKLCLRIADCLAYTLFVHSRKGRSGAWSASRSQCRMEAPGRVRGMRRRHEPRGQRHFVLPPNVYMAPPVGGTFWFQIFIQAPSPEIWSETISGGEEVLAGKWGGLFLGYLLGKNFRRRDRSRSAQEDGCSSLPCRGVLSFQSEAREALAVKRRDFIT